MVHQPPVSECYLTIQHLWAKQSKVKSEKTSFTKRCKIWRGKAPQSILKYEPLSWKSVVSESIKHLVFLKKMSTPHFTFCSNVPLCHNHTHPNTWFNYHKSFGSQRLSISLHRVERIFPWAVESLSSLPVKCDNMFIILGTGWHFTLQN